MLERPAWPKIEPLFCRETRGFSVTIQPALSEKRHAHRAKGAEAGPCRSGAHDGGGVNTFPDRGEKRGRDNQDDDAYEYRWCRALKKRVGELGHSLDEDP